MITLTAGQVQALVDAHSISLDPDDEETEMLKRHNRTLYNAYKALLGQQEEETTEL